MAELLQGSTYVEKLGNQVQPMIQTLFPNNDAVLQDDKCSHSHTRTVQSWLEEHEGEFQHLPWPAQSPDLNIIELRGQFWKLERGSDSHIQHLESNLKIFFKNNGIKFP
jgi:hypothetical protein